MDKDFLTSDEVTDFLPRNIFSPEDIEDAFDFLSEADIDMVEIDTGESSHGRKRARGERLKSYLQKETTT